MLLLLIALAPFVGALLPLCAGRGRNRCAIAAAAAPLLALALVLAQMQAVLDGAPPRMRLSWIPALGFDFALRLDGLALLFALLILGIGLLVILYARYYLSDRDSLPRLYAQLLLFMGAMLGIALADNLLLMMVFWELTSIASFLLIGYWSSRRDARQGALMALIVTGGGGLALLAGILLLGNIVGSFDLDAVFAAGPMLRKHALYPVVLALILIGAFTKSAQFPFQFWLPHAMAAPTPVSAYLHSATMVKAGIFLLARLHPALAGSDLWFYAVTLTGLVTLALGAYLALFQNDLKGLLAYSTVSHLGLIVLLLGLGTPLALVAALFHIINHAIFKASLFMAAGVIEHETGTRDLRRLCGLARYLPHTALLASVASMSMAGVPLLNGFLSKEMFFSETLALRHLGWPGYLVPPAALLAGIFSVAYSLRFVHDVFFNGRPERLPNPHPHEPPRYMKVPIEVLVVLCLMVGIAPGWTVAPLLRAAATAALHGAAPAYSLALWHGFNLPLLMSAVAMAGGVLLYRLRRPLFALHERLPEIDGRRLYRAASRFALSRARLLLNRLDNGSLARYIALLLASALAVAIAQLSALPRLTGEIAMTPPDLPALLGAAFIACAALATVCWQRQRLLSLIALGVVGLMVTLAFARYSAPDLALTQLTVEVVTLLLMLLALHFLPQTAPPESSRARHWRDVLLAVLAGAGAAALVLALLTRPYDSIAQFFIDHSLSKGGGANVVNVILVDFRGFDTLGEITVLVIAAVACAALLDGIAVDAAALPAAADRHPLILAQLARALLPLAMLVAIHIFLRGHQRPGGGFVAGLVTAAAIALQYVAQGERWVEQRIDLSYQRLAGAGVLLAVLTGLGSWAVGHPFLTSAFGHIRLPLVGEIELASALAFDLGVYCAVVGVTLLILSRLGRLGTHAEQRRWN